MDSTDLERIKKLHPFHEMEADELKAALAKSRITKFGEGKMIFKRNEEDPNVYWLLTGSLDLLDEKFEAKNRKAGDDASTFPIDNNNPHRLSAVTTEETRILQVDRGDIGLFSASDGQSKDTDDDVGVDWMSALLSSPLFEFIPPANIQTLFSKFEEVTYDAGEAVIRQGEPGDYFYVIQSGKAKVERTSGDKTSVLAELSAGENFGQDALISDVPRNATVTMMTAGTLMRLSGPDFESLLMRPLIETVTLDEAKEMIEQGDPRTYILDVRGPKELEGNNFEGAVNVPLLSLRKNLPKLKTEAVYITVCDGGRRAELAAYILNENGFTAYVMQHDNNAPGSAGAGQ